MRYLIIVQWCQEYDRNTFIEALKLPSNDISVYTTQGKLIRQFAFS